MRFWRDNIPRFMLVGILVLMSVFTIIAPSITKAENGVADLSLYSRASEVTREFATALAPGTGVNEMYMLQNAGNEGLLLAGNAGGMLGYAEILSDDKGVIGWLMNSYTTASATITYDQLMHVVGDGRGDKYDIARENPFYQYAGYGEVLTEMGLVKAQRPGIAGMGRVIASGLVLIVYLLANVAPFLFRGALMLLTTLNPFRLFMSVIEGTAAMDLGMLSGVAQYVGDMYETVISFSVVFLLPMLLIITAISILMFRTGSAMKKFSRYALRVFMIFAGLPLIGATYTGVIENLESEVAVGSEYADYLILSSYVDFEGWVKYSRLAPPENSLIKHPRFSEDETRTLSDRGLILEINGTRAANERAEELKERYSSTNDLGKVFDVGGTKVDADEERMSSESRNSFTTIFSLLNRHMGSSQYTSSDYDGEVSGQIQQIRMKDKDELNDMNIVKMFSLTASDSRTWSQKLNKEYAEEEWLNPVFWNGNPDIEESDPPDESLKDGDGRTNSSKGLFTAGNALNDLYKFGIYNYNIYNTGGLTYTLSEGYHSGRDINEVVSSKTLPIGNSARNTVGGLSPLAMYNFLNTTFSDTGLTVYSPTKTASDNSRDAYASVTFGGTGVSSMTRWIENVVVMLSLALLSISYGIMMVSVAVKSIPRILTAVFGTALGSIASINKLLISTGVLIIQVVGMIFLYTLSENIIMSLLMNFNDLLDTGGAYFNRGVIFEFLGSFLITVITASMTIFMIHNVKVFREMMEELVSGAINRVMGVLDTGTGGEGQDISKSTGGRLDGKGKLSDEAKEADGRGPLGTMDNLAKGGLVGGAAGLLGEAHGIEARNEQMAQELGLDTGGKMGGIKSRMSTAKDLMGAKAKDVAKGSVGIQGQSHEREVQAKDRQTKAMPYNDEAKKNFVGKRVGEKNKHKELKRASDNEPYTDNADKALNMSSKGQLVDENGVFMGIDDKGVMKPISSMPELKGKPVMVSDAVDKLESIKSQEKAKEARKQSALEGKDGQEGKAPSIDSSHYGLNEQGQPVGVDDVSPLEITGEDGVVPATLDNQGFVTDDAGNRVSASSIIGDVDEYGYEEVVDPDTGETHLRHRGDDAMRVPDGVSHGVVNSDKDSATHANDYDIMATEVSAANERVNRLEQQGAPAYAIQQAKRQAEIADRKASTSLQEANKAIQKEQGNKEFGKPVTEAQVKATGVESSVNQGVLEKETKQLEDMKSKGAPQKDIARQTQRVEQQRAKTEQSLNMAQDADTAQKSGRSIQEVSGARKRVERAEQVFGKAQAAHQQAIATGKPKAEIAKREQAMTKASQVLSNSQTNAERVKQAPQGTPEQIQTASIAHSQAQQSYATATQEVEQLQQNNAPDEDVKASQRKQQQAGQQVKQTGQRRQQMLSPAGWNSQNAPQATQEQIEQSNVVYNQAHQKHETAKNEVQQLQKRGAPAQEVKQAQQRQQHAGQQVSQAGQRRQQMLDTVSGNTHSTPEQIEQSNVAYTKAQQTQATATKDLRELQRRGAPVKEIQQAQRKQKVASQQVQQAGYRRQQMLNPSSGNTQHSKRAPTVKEVPSITPNQSMVNLSAQGVNNYSDYGARVAQESTKMKQGQAKLRQAEQRLKSLRDTKRPPQVVAKAEAQTKVIQSEIQTSQANLTKLRDNAQGLLKSEGFTPVISNRPIRQNGVELINQMVTMGQTQSMYDKLDYQEKTGTLSDAGRKQKESLSGRLTQMRSGLTRAGIREDALQDSAGIRESTSQMQQSWDSFVSGKSTERTYSDSKD